MHIHSPNANPLSKCKSTLQMQIHSPNANPLSKCISTLQMQIHKHHTQFKCKSTFPAPSFRSAAKMQVGTCHKKKKTFNSSKHDILFRLPSLSASISHS